MAKINDRFNSAMLVGHNPGIEGLIRFLTGKLEPMSTAALAIVDLDIDSWERIHLARTDVFARLSGRERRWSESRGGEEFNMPVTFC